MRDWKALTVSAWIPCQAVCWENRAVLCWPLEAVCVTQCQVTQGQLRPAGGVAAMRLSTAVTFLHAEIPHLPVDLCSPLQFVLLCNTQTELHFTFSASKR